MVSRHAHPARRTDPGHRCCAVRRERMRRRRAEPSTVGGGTDRSATPLPEGRDAAEQVRVDHARQRGSVWRAIERPLPGTSSRRRTVHAPNLRSRRDLRTDRHPRPPDDHRDRPTTPNRRRHRTDRRHGRTDRRHRTDRHRTARHHRPPDATEPTRHDDRPTPPDATTRHRADRRRRADRRPRPSGADHDTSGPDRRPQRPSGPTTTSVGPRAPRPSSLRTRPWSSSDCVDCPAGLSIEPAATPGVVYSVEPAGPWAPGQTVTVFAQLVGAASGFAEPLPEGWTAVDSSTAAFEVTFSSELATHRRELGPAPGHRGRRRHRPRFAAAGDRSASPQRAVKHHTAEHRADADVVAVGCRRSDGVRKPEGHADLDHVGIAAPRRGCGRTRG